MSYQSLPKEPIHTPTLELLQPTSPASFKLSRATSSIVLCCGSSRSTSPRDIDKKDVSNAARSTDSSRNYPKSVFTVPGFLAASSATRHFRQDHGNVLHNLIAGSLEIGVFPSLDTDLSAVLPVDYLSKTLVAVMAKDLSCIGTDYDFANRHAMSFDRFFEF